MPRHFDAIAVMVAIFICFGVVCVGGCPAKAQPAPAASGSPAPAPAQQTPAVHPPTNPDIASGAAQKPPPAAATQEAGNTDQGPPPFCLTTGGTTAEKIKTNRVELANRQSRYGGTIVMDSLLLPAGSVDIGIDRSFAPNLQYYGYLLSGSGDNFIMLKNVHAWQAASEDPLVKKEKLSAGKTIVNLRIPNAFAFAWRRSELYVFTCKASPNNPDLVSRTDVRVSPSTYSAAAAWLGVALMYLVAVFAFQSGNEGGYLSYLNPIRMTAGMDGKASLGKLQILFFSLIVFGLILYFLFRTGLLTDISTTILSLLGIAGVGATAAKGTDIQRTTISPENKAYLLRKGWLSPNQTPNANVATWQDLFTTDGEFDVYRYQSFIFSLAVGGALLIGGVTQLSSFDIPTTLLGILGLSQVVYIGGKLVTPTSMAELNKLIGNLRDAEQKFVESAKAANAGMAPPSLAQAINPASQPAYDAYLKLATDVRTLFTSQTGVAVDITRLQPTI